MRDLSVIIPARNEMFLAQTIDDVLKNARADTEVIAICDGYWPDPPIKDNNRVILVHHTDSMGQRASINEGARISQSKYIMKLDAHCALDEGFDAKLIEDCQKDWVMVPAQYNLYAFDWVCQECQNRTYQGFKPKLCEKCQSNNFIMDIIWKPRLNRLTTSWRFDRTLHFQYWREYKKRLEAKGDLIETMSFIGACMFLERDRFWELGGMDENHGSWGQFGTEWACKSWLSGGKLITSKKTWYAHLFRTGNFSKDGSSSFPYPLSNEDIEKARLYSQDLWLNDKWEKAKYPLSWLIEKFKPIPDWHS